MNSTITIKGQVTIPKAMREYLGLEPGDEVVFSYMESGAVRIEPAGRRGAKRSKGRFSALRGRAGKARRTHELMELLRGYGADGKDPGFGK